MYQHHSEDIIDRRLGILKSISSSKLAVLGSMVALMLLGPGSAVAQAPNCLSVNTYGGDPSGVSTSDAAVAALKALIGANNGCIEFGAGTYKLNTQISFALTGSQSLTIRGVGTGATTLNWPSGATSRGISVSTTGFGSVNVKDMRMTTAKANGGTAIQLTSTACAINLTPSLVENVNIFGANGPAQSDYWTTGVKITGLSFVNVRGLSVTGSSTSLGTGLQFEGRTSPWCTNIVLNVSQSNFINTAVGFQYGANSEGVTISQTNFTNGRVGIADVGSAHATQLNVSDSQFDTTLDAIAINSTLANMFIHNNLFFVRDGHAGIVLNAGTSGGLMYAFSNNNFYGRTSDSNGIVVVSNQASSVGTISGNSFTSLHWGIVFTNPLARNWNVQSNAYSMNAANVVNGGANNTIGGGSP